VKNEEPLKKTTADEIIDRAELLHRVSGDHELMKEVLTAYLETCPAVRAELRRAIAGGDPKHVQRAAHTIKGMVGQLGARTASKRL